MSVNLYNTGVSGLLASQQQLATTGNNIANVNTEGYSRQRTEQNASMGIRTGGNYVGTGTYVEDIRRVYDQFSYKEQLLTQTSLSHASSLDVDLGQLDEVMTFSGNAVNDSLNEFYKAINSITDNPSDLGLREMAISQAEILSTDFNSLNQNFDQMVKSTNGEIEEIANYMSQISREIGSINEQILHTQNSVAGQANDLLDARDNLVNELSKYTSVQTVTDNLNVMTVMIGNGATLVAGTTSLSVGVSTGNPDSLKTTLNVVGPNSTVHLKGSTVGGELAAKYEFRDEHLAEVKSEINRVAMSISDTINSVQHSGLDLNETAGADFFTDINSDILQQSRVLSTNSSIEAGVEILDVSKVPTDQFQIKYDGINYTLTNLSNNATESTGSILDINNVLTNEYGIELTISSGTVSDGDLFVIKPTENSAALMNVTLNNGAGIAASSAVAVTKSDNNVSSIDVAITSVSNPKAAQTYAENNNLTVEVYEVSGGGFEYRVYDPADPTPDIATGVYSIGSDQVVDIVSAGETLFQIQISGNPSGATDTARDTFTIGDAFGSGNSINSYALGLTQEQSVINGSKDTFTQSLSESIGNVGSNASSAELTEATAQALFTTAFNRNQSTSGVNLDEEAANLLRFQQAYQAASQIISTANTIFETLLSAVR